MHKWQIDVDTPQVVVVLRNSCVEVVFGSEDMCVVVVDWDNRDVSKRFLIPLAMMSEHECGLIRHELGGDEAGLRLVHEGNRCPICRGPIHFHAKRPPQCKVCHTLFQLPVSSTSWNPKERRVMPTTEQVLDRMIAAAADALAKTNDGDLMGRIPTQARDAYRDDYDKLIRWCLVEICEAADGVGSVRDMKAAAIGALERAIGDINVIIDGVRNAELD